MPSYTVKSGRERLEKIENSWETNAPNDKFAGISLGEITADKAEIDAKLDLKMNLQAQLDRVNVELKDLTRDKMKRSDLVVRAVEGDINHGPDSALYEGFGYIRESDKKRRGGRIKAKPGI